MTIRQTNSHTERHAKQPNQQSVSQSMTKRQQKKSTHTELNFVYAQCLVPCYWKHSLTINTIILAKTDITPNIHTATNNHPLNITPKKRTNIITEHLQPKSSLFYNKT